MIKYIKGDIFDSDADYLVNPVNLVGVMGAGLAKEFKKRYPYMFEQYKAWCELLKFYPNKCDKFWRFVRKEFSYDNPMILDGKLVNQTIICKDSVILFATKKHWKDKSDIALIEQNLSQIVEYFDGCLAEEDSANYPYATIAFPKLGCGCGGLDWENEVKPLMEKYLKDCDSILAEIYI